MSKYIIKLTDEEIEEFFNNNGYELTKDLIDDNGMPIDAIEREDSSIFVRVRNIDKNNLDKKLNKLFIQASPQIMAMATLASSRSGYGRNIDIVYFADYFMSKFCITEEDRKSSKQLCTAYIKYMAQKFPTYKTDFYNYCKSLPEEEIEND